MSCAGFVGEGSHQSINGSFLVLSNNALRVKKSLLVFDFKATNFDYDKIDSVIAFFLIVHYPHLHGSNLDN